MVRLIGPSDNPHVASIIRTVMPEFGANRKGFAIHDEEVDNMFGAYAKTGCAFYVCELDGKILGVGGIAPLQGGEDDTCELRKMYFLPEGRGKGLGKILLQTCLGAARELHYKYCYLETFNTMKSAIKLYEKNGFKKIPGPLGNTGHFACDTFYELAL
jgi:putative acetyltransferase